MTDTLPPQWDPATDSELVCVAARPETHNVTSFVFAAPEPRLFRFQPGQFMTLELGPVQRCYTIASPPTRPFRLEITVKRSPAGPGSAWLHDTIRPGTLLAATGPMGEFTLTPQPGGRYLLLSAGSGITPLMSMARTAHDLGADADLLFVHSASSPADLVFDAELTAMARRPGFRRISIVEHAAPDTAWSGLMGRLSPAMLAILAPDLLTRDVYCCGPAPYMAAARGMLEAVGHDPARYHEESFAFDTPHPPPSSTGEVAAQPTEGAHAHARTGTFTIHLTRTNQTIPCPPGTTILAAARAAGLRLPSACNKGVCGTCKTRLVSGAVELRHAGGIRPREIDAGLTLLCCARPTTDVAIER